MSLLKPVPVACQGGNLPRDPQLRGIDGVVTVALVIEILDRDLQLGLGCLHLPQRSFLCLSHVDAALCGWPHSLADCLGEIDDPKVQGLMNFLRSSLQLAACRLICKMVPRWLQSAI